MVIKDLKCFHSYKILPLVYDESLSYYEAIAKVAGKTNELIDFFNESLETILREKLDDLFIDALYDPETENITLVLGGQNNG